jgi:hypothetical protein
MHAVEDDGRRPDCRMMRSGKAEDAMRAAGMVGIAGRQFRRVLGIVQTKLESRRVIANICTKVKAANCDQQALRGDRICDDDASERPQEPLGSDTRSEYAAHANGTVDPDAATLHNFTTEQTLNNAIAAKYPSGRSDLRIMWLGSDTQRRKTVGLAA